MTQDYPFNLRKGDKMSGCDSDGVMEFPSEEAESRENSRWRDVGNDGRWTCDCEGIDNLRPAECDICDYCKAHKEDEASPDYEDEGWLCGCGEYNTVLDDRCNRCGAEAPWGADDGEDESDEDYGDEDQGFWESREDVLGDMEDYLDAGDS